MNDLTRTLADIAAPLAPAQPQYENWCDVLYAGVTLRLPYRVLNKQDVDDMPEIELAPEREWRVMETTADAHAELRGTISDEVDAMQRSWAADQAYDSRRER